MSKFLTLLILATTALQTFSFKPVKTSEQFRHGADLSMSTNEVKVDSSSVAIKAPAIKIGFPDSTTLFREPQSKGAGTDERFPAFLSDKQLELEGRKLSKIELSYRRLSLLSDISSSNIGRIDKFQKIKAAVITELLPESVLPTSISTFKLNTAGLMDDWSYAMDASAAMIRGEIFSQLAAISLDVVTTEKGMLCGIYDVVGRA